MPVNKTHTTRIEELEYKVSELEKEHSLYFESNKLDKIRIGNLEARLYEVQNKSEAKKNIGKTSIVNILKALVYLPFTTVQE